MRRSLLYSLAVVFAVLNVAHCAPTNSKDVVGGVEKAKATRWPSITSCLTVRPPGPSEAEVVLLCQLLELLTDPDSGRNPFPKEFRYGPPSELMIRCKVVKLIKKTQKEALEQRAARIFPDWKLTGFRVKMLQDRISKKRLIQTDVQELCNELFNAAFGSPDLTWLRKEMESDVSGGWQILSELFSLYMKKRERNPGMILSEEMHRLFTENQDIVKKYLEMDSVERVESMQRWSKEPMTDFAVELWEALDESDHRIIHMKVTNGFRPELELHQSCSKLSNSESPIDFCEPWEQELIRLKLEYESKPELGSCSKHPNSPTLCELVDEAEEELIRLKLENDSKSELKSSSDAA